GRRSPAAADALVHLGRAAVRTTDWLRVQQVVRAFGELPPDPSPSPAAVKEMEEIAAALASRRPPE
ncbi:MAG TPA: hypothetical protein VHG28_07585, partial [Longimicrobiaceae bacterium]|nr:hypothetical protein [Longimicrobiaceae bacterium]